MMDLPLIAPANELELLSRANCLAGLSIGELATNAGLVIPVNMKLDKGWIGLLLERYLGAHAGGKPEQDFAAIGVELKTIPVDLRCRTLETTFVCLARFTGNSGVTWQHSYVRYKLSRVLWIPFEGQRNIQLAQRRIGAPFLWSPDAEEEMQLRSDWEELMELIVLGHVERITAHYGDVLQLRPKASNSRVRTAAIGEFGQSILARPRGFYLKKNLLGSC